MAKLFGNRMKSRVEAREQVSIPTYTIQKKKRKIPIIIPAIVGVILIAFVTIYLPPMLVEEPDMMTRGSVNLTEAADPQALEWAQTYIRNNPEEDFDHDGLTNEQELNNSTGVYIPDNDFDGTTDYAELYLTETNPCYYDNSIINFVQQSDAKTGNAVNTPFKVHDIVMWADDYESKARGGVIPLADGSYNFYRFQGWVQFPSEEARYAYKVVNGVQEELKKNESGYFYVDTKDLVNVRVYAEKPASCYIVSLLGERYMLPDNVGTQILDVILPGKGFGLITIKKALVNDLDDTWSEVAVVNDIITTQIDEFDLDRFGRNDLDLDDLSTIFTQIDSGNNVLISLMSHQTGEVIVEVYGYTSRNNLLVCDPRTGEEYGVLNVQVKGERVLDQEGSIFSYEHYDFTGCGYSSNARHRLMILDAINATTASIGDDDERVTVDDEKNTTEEGADTDVVDENDSSQTNDSNDADTDENDQSIDETPGTGIGDSEDDATVSHDTDTDDETIIDDTNSDETVNGTAGSDDTVSSGEEISGSDAASDGSIGAGAAGSTADTNGLAALDGGD